MPSPRTLWLVASAVGQLGVHRLSRALRGPSPERARRRLARFSLRSCRRLGVDVRVTGVPHGGAALYVSNHRSYLDILILAGTLEVPFLSRAELGQWPIVGEAARDTGTIFVDRSDPHDRARAARELERRLTCESLVVFPEGTTQGDALPGRFEGGLFRLLHRAGVSVVPVTLRYGRREAYWVDELGLAEHLDRAVMAGPTLRAEIHIGTALDPRAYAHARGFRDAAHRAVCEPILTHGEFC